MADSNIQTLDTVKPITLDEYQERTAHLQENTTSLLSTIADKRVQAAGLATQAASLASEVNAVAEQASLSFSKKTWTDNATSGTPITAAQLNRLENAISSLTTAVNNLQDSVSFKQLFKGTLQQGTSINVQNITSYSLFNIVFSNADDNWWPTICINNYNTTKSIYPYAYLRVGEKYCVRLRAELIVYSDNSMLKYHSGGFQIIQDTGEVGDAQPMHIRAIYGIL